MSTGAAADEFVHRVCRDWRSAGLRERDAALCEFAEKLTLSPQRMSRRDLDGLREHGFDDRAIHDAVQVISYFNYINRVAEGLGVQPDGFVHTWELLPRPRTGKAAAAHLTSEN